VVEAMQWTGENTAEVLALAGEGRRCADVIENSHDGEQDTKRFLMLPESHADIGDWIVRDGDGNLTACKPEIFEASYEPFVPLRDVPAVVPQDDSAEVLLFTKDGIYSFGGNKLEPTDGTGKIREDGVLTWEE
jgi:hypothetical protein